MMQSIYRLWLCSPVMLFIILTTSPGSALILRSNGDGGDPSAELKPSSCAQQLEKLKVEARRHVNALSAIADYSLNAPRKSRKLLSTLQTPEPKPKSLRTFPDLSLASRRSQSLPKPKSPSDSVTEYLNSLNHTAWVSECLKGGNCSDPGTPARSQVSSPKLNPLDIMSDENPANAGQMNNANETSSINTTIPDTVNVNITDSNPLINLIPTIEAANSELNTEISVNNYTIEKAADHSFKPVDIEPDFQVGMPDPMDQRIFRSESGGLVQENRLVHYNPLFLPVKIQFIPHTYYERLPLSTESYRAFDSSTMSRPLSRNDFNIDSLDGLAANYGNDLVKRGSTGKRESTFMAKEAVSTNYPEMPSYQPVDNSFINKKMEGGNNKNKDGVIYLFLGGNWMANFRDNPQLYIQPVETEISKSGCSGSDKNVNLQPYRQPYAIVEPISERPAPRYDARSAFPVAARNSYSWYDYNTMTNDVSQRPNEFSSGPLPFTEVNRGGLRKDQFRRKDDLNYEDALVNLPVADGLQLPTYDTSKPEDFLESDINPTDMFIVGTQLMGTLQLQPVEHRENTSDPAYGRLVADVSSRSSPKLEPSIVAENQQLLNSARTGPPGYFPPSWSNEFEFVSGQWVKRRPLTGIAAQGLVYDRMGQRQIRNAAVGWPEINQQPVRPFKSTC